MTHTFLLILAAVVLVDLCLVLFLALGVVPEPRIQPPSPPAKPAVFHLRHVQLLCPGKSVPVVEVSAASEWEAIEGLLLTTHLTKPD